MSTTTRRQVANGTATATTAGDKVTITSKQHEDLRAKAANAGQLKKDFAAEQRKTVKLEREVDKLRQQLDDQLNQNGVLTEAIASKDNMIKEYQQIIADLQAALRKNGQVHESELNRDLTEQTFHAAKVYLSRNVRWFGDHEDAEKHTLSLIKYLPKGADSLCGLKPPEYAFKYRQTANRGLQACKQNVQAEAKKAAVGTYLFM